jgi:predicted outer membrane lipoprotein
VIPRDFGTQETAVTRVVAPSRPKPRTPRTVPSRTPPPQRAPQRRGPSPAESAPAARRNRGARRFAWVLGLLLVAAIAAIAIAVAVHQTSDTVHYEKVVANDAQQAINKVQSIISDHTK